MELTQNQLEAAKACGCTFFPATEGQVARLAMQRRIFSIAGKPLVATRDGGGFHETHATLAVLLQAHGRGATSDAGETVQEAAAADAASEREIAGERGAGGAQEVWRRPAATRPKGPWRGRTRSQ
ncbi:MAG: hypothetical protein QJR07_20010 [Acetobacteraceae bacterium]|nr:hypothetical protein [Acetobacteraceae bacterium]